MNNMTDKNVKFKKCLTMFNEPVDNSELKKFIEDVSGKKLKDREKNLIDNLVFSSRSKTLINKDNAIVSFDPAKGKDCSAKIRGTYDKKGVFTLTEVIYDYK
jgi:hypothetical protein|tara:strand:+ start:114 stop:419 length:306 start_codon:yes stop_codon:yes gene_type:complete